jgi:putative integral membrane protein (TIGR02587 family)
MVSKKQEEHYVRALGRAFAGAVIFAFPLLMTMEMWELGFYMSRHRLVLFVLVTLPMLVLLSYYSGFQRTHCWRDDIMDALTAYAVGFLASAALLLLFGIVQWNMPASEIVGKIVLQSVPASIGAMLARRQLGEGDGPDEEERKEATYLGELFLMSVGALFVGFNVAPTEEMVLISYKMTAWHTAALALLSIGVMHAFVYTVGFEGQESMGDSPPHSAFLRFTLVGYGLALLISLYLLWTFERTAGMSASELVRTVVVLGFPGALGAATARLIV